MDSLLLLFLIGVPSGLVVWAVMTTSAARREAALRDQIRDLEDEIDELHNNRDRDDLYRRIRDAEDSFVTQLNARTANPTT